MKSLLPVLTTAIFLGGFSCGSSGSGSPDQSGIAEYPSVEGTTWIVSVLWSDDTDSAFFRPRFDAGGTGVQVDTAGVPTKLTFTWKQDGQTVSWNYPSKVEFTGALSANGDTLSGTGTYQSRTSVWRAVKF